MRSLIVISLISLFLSPCLTLRCYDCNTHDDEMNCETVNNLTRTQVCEELSDNIVDTSRIICRKSDVRTKMGEFVIVRGCTFKKEVDKGPCSYLIRSTNCYDCDTDLCNGSSNIFKVSSFIISIVMINILKLV